MPDAALAATERQFLRLVGASNRIAQVFVHPFTMAGVERRGAARERVEQFYEPFDELRREGLDALIVTGANVTEADITREAFWEPAHRGTRLGPAERGLDPVLVPREPCRVPVAPRGSAHSPSGEAMGGLLGTA